MIITPKSGTKFNNEDDFLMFEPLILRGYNMGHVNAKGPLQISDLLLCTLIEKLLKPLLTLQNRHTQSQRT